MNFFVFLEVLVVLGTCFFVTGSPVNTGSPGGPLFVLKDKADFPVADQLEEDKSIKTHVIGKMDDLEATTWISSLSELNFTFPPDMAESLELQDFVDSP